MSPDVMLQRLFRFCEHLQKEDHFYPQEHEENLESLEKQFHANNAGPPENIHLSVRPSVIGEPSSREEPSPNCLDRPALLVFSNTSAVPSLWRDNSANPRVLLEVEQEAANFKKKFQRDVQFIFSRVQHHWHARDERGNRVPLKYCHIEGKKRHHVCKMGFPRKFVGMLAAS